jgi:hypothetical protein
MPDTIRDGKGKGYLAGVTSNNNLMTEGVADERISNASLNGNAFGIGIPLRTGTTTGGTYLWIKNTDPNRILNIDHLTLFYNGGSTNHDRTCEIQLRFNGGTPSANNTAGTEGNLHRGSGKSALMDWYYWDEVGDGMTVADEVSAMYGIFGKGMSFIDMKGSLILDFNQTVSFYCKPEEIGEIAIGVLCYYEEVE